jgi:hypothetical protein
MHIAAPRKLIVGLSLMWARIRHLATGPVAANSVSERTADFDEVGTAGELPLFWHLLSIPQAPSNDFLKKFSLNGD